jgi:hypothetical protein
MLIFVRIVFGGLRTVGWLHAIVAVAEQRYVVGSVGRGVGLDELGVYDSSAQDLEVLEKLGRMYHSMPPRKNKINR